MEIMAFLIGAAARLNPSSDKAAMAWAQETNAVGETDRLNEPQTRLKDWPSHWAVTKYL